VCALAPRARYGAGVKKALIIGLALIFVLPVGVGMFGGGPRPTANRIAGDGDDDRAALMREISEGVDKHCAKRHPKSAERKACAQKQFADLNATIRLLNQHRNKRAGKAIEACLAEFAPAFDANTDWTQARACAEKRTKQ